MLRLFRFVDFWNRKPLDNSAERIERALFDRTRRLVAGLHVDDRFESISGSLVVAEAEANRYESFTATALCVRSPK